MLFTVAIPTALPLIFTGLRISLGTAWMTLCAAEMLASNRGLGYMIQLNRTLARADLIVVAMLTIGVIGTDLHGRPGRAGKEIRQGRPSRMSKTIKKFDPEKTRLRGGGHRLSSSCCGGS